MTSHFPYFTCYCLNSPPFMHQWLSLLVSKDLLEGSTGQASRIPASSVAADGLFSVATPPPSPKSSVLRCCISQGWFGLMSLRKTSVGSSAPEWILWYCLLLWSWWLLLQLSCWHGPVATLRDATRRDCPSIASSILRFVTKLFHILYRY